MWSFIFVKILLNLAHNIYSLKEENEFMHQHFFFFFIKTSIISKWNAAATANLPFPSVLPRKRASTLPTRLLFILTVGVAFTALCSGFVVYKPKGNIPVTNKFIRNLCVCVCVSKQHFAECRLSISNAGSDWSSRLWEERAGPQTVSGFQWILCLWVSVKLSVHMSWSHLESSEVGSFLELALK